MKRRRYLKPGAETEENSPVATDDGVTDPLLLAQDFSQPFLNPLRPDRPFYPHPVRAKMSFLNKPAPRILISPEAYRTMLVYVERAPLEVGWQGTVIRQGNDFHIMKVFLLEQTVSTVTTVLSIPGRNELCMELLASGPEGLEALNNLRFWGHSHVRMGVAASPQDEKTMDDFKDLPWAVRGIFNKLGQANFSLFLYEEGLRFDDVPWLVFDHTLGKEISFHARTGAAAALANAFPTLVPGKLSTESQIPEELLPDESLRLAINAEYDKKVREGYVLVEYARQMTDKIKNWLPQAGDGCKTDAEQPGGWIDSHPI